MPEKFLTAQWRNLLMANFEIDASVLRSYVPYGTELDEWNGKHYVSLVGFLFQDTRVIGLSVPFHRNFEEVNLRFYVRYKHAEGWRRGVVFVKEFVPKRMITMVANALYGEKYATLPMRHIWEDQDQQRMKVRYEWKSGEHWNHLEAIADKAATIVVPGTKEHFITEHYWGYAQLKGQQTFQYQVTHPSWRVHLVHEYSFNCDTEALYGSRFVDTFCQTPASVFLAEGSDIEVMKGKALI
ncbi:DUF2071 domain-containing protein [Chitinophaga sp. SYP-B3965]|uniref:YqjF family protein n=1 Tax=Chitinophaga sp. SYP-B3965 TaxID=2663120 RepID=UPI001299FF10|nr:DUF2071 domain-containing protein [Chitinophaga sp. SYP-B3965]MRG47139.1 DUF2071 domain-containing protein [Chitinophaga sp. SYP-B3965]